MTRIQTVANGSGGVAGLIGAQSIAITRDGKNLYVASAIDDALVMFTRNESTGLLTYLGHLKQGVGGVDGLNEAVAIRESADGKNLYVAAVTSNSLAVFNRDVATGLVTFAQKLTGATGGSFSVDLSPDQRHVYLSSGNSNAVNVYNRNLTTGQLTLTQSVTSATPGYSTLNQPWGISVSPDGKNVYVATKLSQGVIVLNRNEVTGHVSFNEFVPDPYSFANPDPVAVLVSPDGHHVAVTFQTGGGMAIYSRNQTTGKLTLVEFYLDGVGGFNDLRGAWDVEFSNDGRSLYLVAAYDDAVYAFDRAVGEWVPSSAQASVAVGQVTTLNTFGAMNLVPMVESITYSGTTPVTTSEINFDVVFSEPVTGVDPNDFTFVGSFTGATATGISGSGDTYVLTVSLADGLQGTLSTRTIFNGSIVDNEGQTLGTNGSAVFDTIDVDRKAPTVLSASRLDSNPTNKTSLRFQLVFSEPVSGLVLSDFSVSASGVTGGTAQSLTGSGNTYVVTVSYTSGEGSLSLVMADNDTIFDSVGHPLGGAGTGTFALPSYTIQLGTIEGSIFSDLNSNGVKDAGESGISGQTIYIDVDGDGTLDAGEPTAVTASASGAYAFTGLVDGNYTVRWLAQSPYVQTLPAGGGAHVVPLAVASGISIANFGVHEALPGSINGRLWNDIDQDGVFDVTELGIVGLTVYVDLNDNGAFDSGLEPSDVTDADDLGTTTVDESGQYSFSGLQPGNHSIRVVSNQWQFTNPAPWESATSTTYTDATHFSANNKSLRISPDGNFVYVFDHLSNNIVVLRLPTTSSGSLTQVQVLTGEFTGTSNAIGDIAFAPNGSAMYMIENQTNRLAVFSRNAVNGTLTRVQSLFPPGTFPYSIEVAPDGNHLYVGGGYIAPYAINPVNGTLTALASTGALARVQDIEFNSDGTRLYAVDYGNVLMRVYSRNVSTGAITQIQATDSQIATSFFSNWSAVMSRDDQDLYVAAPLTDLVWHFGTLANGTLSFEGVYDLDTDNVRDLPMDLELSPDGKTLLVALGLNDAIQVLHRNTTNGSLTIGPVIGTPDPSLTNIYENSSSLMDLTPDGSLLVRANARASEIELYRVSFDPIDAIEVSILENQTMVRDLGLMQAVPEILSVVPSTLGPTNASSISVVVTFNEPVTGVDTNDFAVDLTGLSGVLVQSVTGSGDVYTVTLDANAAAGQGTVVLRIVDNDTIVDSVLLPLDGAGTSSNAGQSSAISLDYQNPVVTSIVTGSGGVTGSNNALFTVTYSEPVNGVDASDFVVVMTGGVSGAVVQSVTPRNGGSIFDVVVASGTGDGTLGLNLIDNDSILDTVGLALGGIGSGNGDFTGNVAIVERNPLRNIIGTLYRDDDRDGQRDAGEVGVSGLRVYVDTNSNSVWNTGEPFVFTGVDNPATTEVDESGNYRFDGLALGTYTVRVETNATYYTSAASSTSVTLIIQSPADNSSLLGVEPNLTAIRGAVFNDLNANGVVDLGEIGFVGATVYRDLNNNGVLNSGEPSQLTVADDPATTEINEAGRFDFGQLPLGTNRVRVQVPTGYLATAPTLFSGNITSSIDTFNNVSFLLHENLTTVSGTLYNDLNYNGTQDAGEGPRAGFVVYVDANANGVRDTGERFATSAADGTYTITNVPTGNSLIRVVTTSETLVTSPTIQTERLFVSSGSTLREINPVTGAQISSFTIVPIATRGASSGGLAFDGTSVFMLDRIDNRILKINPGTGVVTSALGPLPSATYGGLAYVNSLLYASNTTNERILAINPVTGAVVNTFNIATINAGTPFYSGTIDLLDGLGESADGTKLLAGTASPQRLVINPTTGIVEGAYTDSANQRDLGIAGGNGRIFIGRRDTSSIQIYDAAGTLTATLSGVATPDDVAAASITSQGANVTLIQDQQLSGVNFGISSAVGTITGRQYNDVNSNGSFDAGDIPLAGVTVFVDTNNNNWPDATEPQAISASDGTYTISGVSTGSKIVRAVSPNNARPSDSYPTSNRLFGMYIPSGSSVVYLRELNPVTGAVLSTVPTTIPILANSPFIEVAFDGERLFYFDSFHDIAYELAIDGTVLEQRPLGQLLSTGVFENVVDFGPVAIRGTIYSVRGSGLDMKLVRYDADVNDFIDVRPITFDRDVSPSGSSTAIPTGSYASSASTDGNSIVVTTTDDRVFTIDPTTGIATFSAVPSSSLPIDYARETLANETFITNNGAVRVYDSAGNLTRTFSNTPIYYALGGGLYRDQHANVTVVAGQTLNNVDLRFKSTRGNLSGTIATSPLGGGSGSPVDNAVVYLDINRNSVLDVGEPQTITNSSGQYAFNGLEPGDYFVRQVPLANQTVEASAPNYNRLFTRIQVNGVATISELDPFTGQVLRQFPTPGTNSFQSGLALHGETLYVSQSGAMYALNANTGTLLSTTPLPIGQLDGLAVLDNKAYVLHSSQNRIYVVDLATKQIQQTIDVAAANPTMSLNLTQGLGESADGDMLAARNNFDVVIIDPQTGIVVSTLSSVSAGSALAGADGRTYDQGHYINNIQQSTEVRDRFGLIRRRIPWSFGVTANGYAAANIQATEHRVHVFAEQSISGLDFDNLEQGSVSGIQYVDVNENGTFDLADTALAGVIVYLDLNNNNLADTSEPQTISAVDGTYTIENLPSGNAVLRSVSPDNHVLTGSHSTQSRLFSTRNLTDATSSTGLRLNLYEISPANGTIIAQIATSIETAGQQSLAYDGETIIITDTFRHKLVEMAADGTIVDEVDLPNVASTPVGVMGPVVVEGTIFLLTYDNGLGYTWRTFDKRTNEFSSPRLLVLPENPPYGSPSMTIALSESPDGKSALAFNYQSQRVYVIDPRTATVIQDLSTNNAPSDFTATASIGGDVLVNSSGGRIAVLDAEYRYLRDLNSVSIFPNGLGGGEYTDYGRVITAAAGVALINVDQGYRSAVKRDGTLDTTFGRAGLVSTEFFHRQASYETARAAVIDSQNRIVTVADGGHIVRYASDGSIDTSFANGGFAQFPGTVADIAIQSNGRMVVAGSSFDGATIRFVVARYLANGILDSTFGESGVKVTEFAGLRVSASAVVIGHDGKIIVAGTGRNADSTNYDFVAARYLADGSLDTNFDGDGRVITNIGTIDFANDLLVESDGSIIIVGSARIGSHDDIAIVKYLANGSLATYFGNAGIRMTDFGNGADDEARSVAVESGGRITVVGRTKVGAQFDIALARYSYIGTLDTSFGTNGLVTTDFFGQDDSGLSVTIQPTGAVVVTGEVGFAGSSDVAVLRYNSAGLLDTAFDADGKVTTDVSGQFDAGYSVVIDASGKIVVAGSGSFVSSNYDVALLRYNTDGSLDTSFDTDGKVTTAIRTSTDEAASVAVLANGSFVLAGSAQNVNKDFALSRHSAIGQLDYGFGTDGRVTTPISSGDDLVRRVIETPTGKLLAVGRTQSGSNWNVALAQYNANGSLDNTFGTGGIIVTDFGSADDDAVDVAIDSVGNINVAGHRSGVNGMDIVVAQYGVDGVLNTAFGTGGIVTTSLGASDEIAAKLVVQFDGKLVLAGYTTANSNIDMLVALYNADGTLDTAFDSDGIAIIDFGSDDYAQSVTVSYNGKITVAGATGTGNALDFALARLTPSGSSDPSFGVAGKVTTDFSGNVDAIRDIATAEDGKLVATGFTHNGTNFDFALARYTANGLLDTTFATGGRATTGIGPNDDYAHAIAFDSGGDILVAGSANVGASTDFAVARYTNTSSVDVAIDPHGNLIVNDRDPGGTRTISFNGTSIIVSDPTGPLTTAVDEAIVINPHTLAIPLSIVSGSVHYRGGDGQQTLTVDLATGSISRPINISDSVDNFLGSISLELIGDVNAANVVHTVNGPLSGAIAITGNSLITYKATRKLNQRFSAQNVTVNLPDIAKSQSLINDGPGRIQLLGSQSPEIHLAVPSQSLSVHLGGGVQNTLDISELSFAASTSLFIDGDSIDDEIIVSGPVSLAGGNFSLSADAIEVLAPVSTSGGNVSWASTGHVRLGDSLTTAGGNVSITADSNADGSGLFQIQPTIATKYANPQLVTPNDPAAGDWFGSAVAVSGDTAFIAADGDQEHGNDSGSVYVFTKIAGVWTQTQKITPADGAAFEYFGYPLAMSGDTVVFSAQRQDVGGVVDAGAAYVYRKIAGTWTFEQKLTASDADAQDWFATRVAIQGNTIVATAPQDNAAAFLAGAVYVFTRTGNVWTQTQKLTASDAYASLQLGDSIAIDDNTIIVGASKDTHSGTLSGSAYVFTEVNGVWTQSQKLTAFAPAAFEEFGHSVAVDGDSLLVGAKSHDADGVVNTGAAFAFIRENGVWKPQAKLVHEGALESNHLGIAVSLVGDTAVVGSLGGGGTYNIYGGAFTFVRRGDAWYQQSKYTTGEASDFYSFAVAHDASTAVVGAYLADSPLSDAGSAYFYDSVASSDMGGSINVGSGNLSLTSATMELLGSVAGTGTLLMQPSRPDASIGLGGAAGTFNIDDFELSQISDGFSHITIGNAAAGSGIVSVSSSTFNDPVTIAGGTLREDKGGITAPSITLSGNISPGNSPGLMHLNGNTTVSSGSTVTIEFAGNGVPGAIDGYDQLLSTGRVDIGSNVTLVLIGLGNTVLANRITIVSRVGGSGTFNGAPEGHIFTDLFNSTQDFRITYSGGDGDDIELVRDVVVTPSQTAINENLSTEAADLLFAKLSALDANNLDSHTYELVSGIGDTDNARFIINGNELKLRKGQVLDYETQSSYTVRVRATDAQNIVTEKLFNLQVNNLIEISKSDITINAGSVQRSRVDSVTIEFDTDVILQEGAITVHKRGAGGGIAGTVLSPIVGVTSRTFTLGFAGAFTEFGSLADGNYELRIDATKIISVGSFGLDTNQDGVTGDNFVFGDEATDKFYRYFGDVDGNRSVNLFDYTAFRNAYGKALGVDGYRSDLDFNQDGLSNLVDFTQFRNRYGSSLLF